MRNPHQFKKKVQTRNQAVENTIEVHFIAPEKATSTLEAVLHQATQKLLEMGIMPNKDEVQLFILGRYNHNHPKLFNKSLNSKGKRCLGSLSTWFIG